MLKGSFDIIGASFYLSTACYIASMTAYILFLFKPIDIFLTSKKENIEKYAFFFISAGFFIHFGTIIFQSIKSGTIPLNNIEQALSILALAVAGGFSIFKKQFNLSTIGIFISPVIVFIMVGLVILPLNASINSSAVQKFWLISHLLLIIIGQLVFVLAFIAGVFYIFYDKLSFAKFLPLDVLDYSNYIFLCIGFSMLTFGLITGFIYANAAWGDFWSWSPGILWAMATWIIYSIILYMRINFDWKGTKPAIATMISFVFLILSYIGISQIL
ncbi:MAG: cytochrome c biogenesis protein CcsA [Desulfobacteraceae bacterium]|nr:cytochrome c biogenesis protein CcsA [Desulfobacteraceae bacterium]